MPPAAAPGLLAWVAAESGGRSVAVALSSPAAGGEGTCAEITDVLRESLVLAEGSEGLKGSQKREKNGQCSSLLLQSVQILGWTPLAGFSSAGTELLVG